MLTPIFRLGLIGFPNAIEIEIEATLRMHLRQVAWVVGPLLEADALWVNGARAKPLPGGYVRVESGNAHEPDTVLNMAEIDRPIAFAQPLHGYLTPSCVVELRDAASVSEVLADFEATLQPLLVQLALAHHAVEERRNLASPAYHVMAEHRLIASVDLGREVAIDPLARTADLARAHWSARERESHQRPAGYYTVSFAELMWQYSLHSQGATLPTRYRRKPIYFRKMPTVDERLVRDSHMAVLAQLCESGQDFALLRLQTGLGEPRLAQVLSAHFAGSITTDPQKARAGVASVVRPVGEATMGMKLPGGESTFGGTGSFAAVAAPPGYPDYPLPGESGTLPVPLRGSRG